MTTSHQTAPSRHALGQQAVARAHWLLLQQNDGRQSIELLHSQGRCRVLPTQDRESSWLAEREHQCVCRREVASRSFQEATETRVPRTTLHRVRLRLQREFQLLLRRHRQRLAAIRTGGRSSAQQEVSLQSGVFWCERIDAESMQWLATLLQ